MRESSSKKSILRQKFFPPMLFFLLAAVVIYFFPRQGKFKYNFSEGRPWNYELLTAPFDFPVYKPVKVIKNEQDSIMQYYEPYYALNPQTKEQSIRELRGDFNKSELSTLNMNELLYIERKLSEIYDKGIISISDYSEIAERKTKSIRVVEDNMAVSRKLSSLYTTRMAYEEIIDNIPNSFNLNKIKAAQINNYIKENLIYDKVTSTKVEKEYIQRVSLSEGMIQAGQRIIDQGEIVNNKTYSILSSLKKVIEERTTKDGKRTLTILGEAILILSLISLLFMYLLFFRPNVLYQNKEAAFIVITIGVFMIATEIVLSLKLFNVYTIPYAIGTILVRTFIDSRTALFSSLITILVCSLMVPVSFEFVIIQATVAMTCIFLLKELSERSQLIRSSFFILVTYIAIYSSLTLYNDGSFANINLRMFLYFFINFFFIMFAYLLVYIVEKLFGFISGVSMIELSNINKPLLQELSEVAPGTFQHSMQVSNLASAAASKIGANASLVRTAALYHDIGKMENPAFFTENQTPGMNPHAGLPFQESARIIISHVKDGARMAQKRGLPKQITDFILTHHGRSKPRYFYNSWINANPDKEIDEEAFTYPGPNPFSKETAILMMADVVEAATRSLPKYTEEAISGMVNKLIDGIVAEGLLKNTPMTFKDVETAKAVFINKLLTIYHSRISYPDINDKKE